MTRGSILTHPTTEDGEDQEFDLGGEGGTAFMFEDDTGDLQISDGDEDDFDDDDDELDEDSEIDDFHFDDDIEEGIEEDDEDEFIPADPDDYPADT